MASTFRVRWSPERKPQSLQDTACSAERGVSHSADCCGPLVGVIWNNGRQVSNMLTSMSAEHCLQTPVEVLLLEKCRGLLFQRLCNTSAMHLQLRQDSICTCAMA